MWRGAEKAKEIMMGLGEVQAAKEKAQQKNVWSV